MRFRVSRALTRGSRDPRVHGRLALRAKLPDSKADHRQPKNDQHGTPNLNGHDRGGTNAVEEQPEDVEGTERQNYRERAGRSCRDRRAVATSDQSSRSGSEAVAATMSSGTTKR